MKNFATFLLGCSICFSLTFCYGGSGGPPKSPAVGMALEAPSGSANREAAMKNDEGLGHLKQEHWETSAGYFQDAIKLDPNLAEAHFNLALAYDEMGKHGEASDQFKKAKELAPNNPKIVDNDILKKHLSN